VIEFHYEIDFKIENEDKYRSWISDVIVGEGKTVGDINYIFCDDEYLHKINVEFLNHDTLTDIISFDYVLGNTINGDVYISVERVRENAIHFEQDFQNELSRVMIHGVLHYLGLKDKTEEEKIEMRNRENDAISFLNI
jgi:rRNA maturation RNase YbeY